MSPKKFCCGRVLTNRKIEQTGYRSFLEIKCGQKMSLKRSSDNRRVFFPKNQYTATIQKLQWTTSSFITAFPSDVKTPEHTCKKATVMWIRIKLGWWKKSKTTVSNVILSLRHVQRILSTFQCDFLIICQTTPEYPVWLMILYCSCAPCTDILWPLFVYIFVLIQVWLGRLSGWEKQFAALLFVELLSHAGLEGLRWWISFSGETNRS